MPTLTLSRVTKRYSGRAVLSDATLQVAAGERVALLGHNGAGKSTLMKIILGLVAQDSGQIAILGAAPGSKHARTATSYLPENAAFHPSLTGLEQLQLYLRLRGGSSRMAIDLIERVGLGAAATQRIGTYSKGMRQRIGLAQALIGEPELMVLDEPTSGLDPISRREFYDILDGLAAAGAAILISSHALTEVEARTDRIVILSKGVMVANDNLANLRRQSGLLIKLQLTTRPESADEVARRLNGRRIDGARIELSCRHSDKLARLAEIADLGSLVEDVEILPPSLEELYAHYSRGGGV